MAYADSEPALAGLDEAAMIGGWLDHHRAVLVRKCSGLGDAQLRERALPPSTLSLLGLLRHMSDNEVWWFQVVMNGEPGDSAYTATDDDPDSDLNPPPDATFEATLAVFEASCARSREITGALATLDVEGTVRGEPVSGRWVLSHMLEEYARHNGHADLLRERLDGATG